MTHEAMATSKGPDQQSSSAAETNAYNEDALNDTGEEGEKLSARSQEALLWFRDLLQPKDVVRLLRTYQDVIGDMHPIVDIDSLTQQVGTWSSRPGSERRTPMEEDDLMIMNLTLAIALCADPRPDRDAAKQIFNHCKEALDSKLASSTISVKNVVISLLMVRVLKCSGHGFWSS